MQRLFKWPIAGHHQSTYQCDSNWRAYVRQRASSVCLSVLVLKEEKVMKWFLCMLPLLDSFLYQHFSPFIVKSSRATSSATIRLWFVCRLVLQYKKLVDLITSLLSVFAIRSSKSSASLFTWETYFNIFFYLTVSRVFTLHCWPPDCKSSYPWSSVSFPPFPWK